MLVFVSQSPSTRPAVGVSYFLVHNNLLPAGSLQSWKLPGLMLLGVCDRFSSVSHFSGLIERSGTNLDLCYCSSVTYYCFPVCLGG